MFRNETLSTKLLLATTVAVARLGVHRRSDRRQARARITRAARAAAAAELDQLLPVMLREAFGG